VQQSVEYDEETQEIKIIEEAEKELTQMILIPDKNIDQIDASCSYCHSIFLGDFKVFECDKCGSFYHEPCLEKMIKEIKACRYCGAKIIDK